MIETFIRCCFESTASAHKERWEGFSHRACFENFCAVTDFSKVNPTFFLDTSRANGRTHFIQEQKEFPVIEIQAGSEGQAFLTQLDHVLSLPLPRETIIYLLEDDYLHRKGWETILREAFTLNGVDYATLYDAPDKYTEAYRSFRPKLFHTQSCHWRTTPSTTNTFAVKFKTLKRDADTHRFYSDGKSITQDHAKFCRLRVQGATLVSAVPGFSTHVDPSGPSPCYPWNELLEKSEYATL